MALHLYWQDLSDKPESQLRLLSSYEAGHVTLFARTDTYLDRSVEGKSWDGLWTVKAHVESGGLSCHLLVLDVLDSILTHLLCAVMGMTVSSDHRFALSVSADHLIGKYSLIVISAISPLACLGFYLTSSH